MRLTKKQAELLEALRDAGLGGFVECSALDRATVRSFVKRGWVTVGDSVSERGHFEVRPTPAAIGAWNSDGAALGQALFIVRVLTHQHSFTEPQPRIARALMEIRGRYRELAKTLSLQAAAEQAAAEWLMRQLSGNNTPPKRV